LKEQRKMKWSSISEDNVVMRTESIGHGYHGLELCAKKEDYLAKGNGRGVTKMKGLGDDIIIPLGFRAAVRKKMKHDHKIHGTCSMSKD
jgi:hypothetical protein